MARRLTAERLESRELLAVLSAGSGDGSLQVWVNEQGAFGRSGNLQVNQVLNPSGPREVNDALYDPLGPLGVAGTVFESGLAIKVDNAPVTFLTAGTIAGTGGNTNGQWTTPPTGGTGPLNSVFYYPNNVPSNQAILRITLSQQLIPKIVSGTTPIGVTLQQRYEVTNLTTANVSLQIYRYMDGDLLYGSFLDNGGGMRQVFQNGPQSVWMTNTSTNTNRNDPTFLEIRAQSSGVPTSDRWEVGLSQGGVVTAATNCSALNPCKNQPTSTNSPLVSKILNNTPLADDIIPSAGDSDGNNKVDTPDGDDWAVALRNTFTLAGGPNSAALVYITTTQWGDPEIGDPEPDPVPDPQRGTVTGSKFSDADGDGVRDAGEQGLPGFRIYADLNNNGIFEFGEPNAITNASGFYQFVLDAGSYNIREVQQANYTQTAPAGGAFPVTIVNAGQVVFGVDFGNKAAPATMAGTVFVDANKNRVFDAGEAGLANATIFIDLNNDGQQQVTEPTTTSAANGAWSIANLNPQSYIVRQIPPAGYEQTFPINNGPQVVTLQPAQVSGNINFGNALRDGQITGKVYIDTNGNGLIDLTEPGAGGVIVYVDRDNDCQIGLGENAVVTGPGGTFGILGVTPGSYNVRMSLPFGLTAIIPPESNGCPGAISVTVQPGQVSPEINFLAADSGAGAGPDFGDAPAPYPTLFSQNGARHTLVEDFQLGALLDGEVDGQPTALADGDNFNLFNDEDGIQFLTPMVPGQPASIRVTVNTGGRFPGRLQGFVDFNGDGDWNDAGERIILDREMGIRPNGFNQVQTEQPFTQDITFTVPANAVLGDTYARFRYGYESGLGPTGPSIAGEVEDYRSFIVSNVPIAVPDTFEIIGANVPQTLDVLANDIPSSAGGLVIDSVNTAGVDGIVTIAADGRTLTFTATLTSSVETFTYTVSDPDGNTATATVTLNVIINPVAVDDVALIPSAGVPLTPDGYFIDVLANDFSGSGGLIIVGTLPVISEGGTLTPNADGTALLYNPPSAGFQGTEQFQYIVLNDAGLTDMATVTIQVMPNPPGDDQMEFIIQLLALDGTPLVGPLAPGQQFQVQVSVVDLRTNVPDRGNDGIDDRGVFAAYLDLLYDASRIQPVADVSNSLGFEVFFGTNFQESKSGDASIPGIIDEIGASGGNEADPQGPTPSILFTTIFQVRSDAPDGPANFFTDPADSSPFHDVLLFFLPENPLNPVVPDNLQLLNQAAIAIDANAAPFVNGVPPAGEPGGSTGGSNTAIAPPITGSGRHQNNRNPFDVNRDNSISPLDALLVVNSMNSDGARDLVPAPTPSAATGSLYYDVNGDDNLSPLDALLIINRLNAQVQGEGEAYAGSASVQTPATPIVSITLAPGETAATSVMLPLDAAEGESDESGTAETEDFGKAAVSSRESPASEAAAPQVTPFVVDPYDFELSLGGGSGEDEAEADLLDVLAQDACVHWH